VIEINHFVVYNKNKSPHREWIYVLTTANQVEAFIEDYQRSRVVAITSVRAVLNRALEFEQRLQKAFYEFTTDEAMEMYKSVNAISARSLQNVNLILKHAARWMLYNQNKDIDNVYDNITKDLIQTCVNVNKKEGLILDKNQLINIQNDLLNYVDKAILFLLFEGVGGHKLKELMFMDWSQVSRRDLKIYFRGGKIISITPTDYELLRQAFHEDELMSFGITSRVSKVKSLGLYKARFNALSDNDNREDDGDVERRYRFAQRRLILISKDLGITLTSSGLQESGFLHYIREGMESSGLNFLEFIKTEECKTLARRYDLYTDLYVQIVKEKFYKYFQ
jgi:hypothetical protein